MGTLRRREATLKGFDSIVYGSLSKIPVQGSLFFRGNWTSLHPSPHPHTPCAHSTPLSVQVSFLLFPSQHKSPHRAYHPSEWTSSLPVLKTRVRRREASQDTEGVGNGGGSMTVEEAWRENPEEENAERQGQKKDAEGWTTLGDRSSGARSSSRVFSLVGPRASGVPFPPGPHLFLARRAAGSLPLLHAPLS